jgi:hypothetical protein
MLGDRPVRQVLDCIGVGVFYEGSAHVRKYGVARTPAKGRRDAVYGKFQVIDYISGIP